MQQDETNQKFKQQMQEMLKTISHDIQNPLTNVELLLGLLQKNNMDGQAGDAAALQEKMAQYIPMMMRSVSEMKHKFHGLKILRERMFVQPQPIRLNMHTLISEVIDELNIDASQITLSLDENRCFWADQEAMQRVVYELLDNALHAIHLKQGMITVSVKSDDGIDVLIIEDDGYGVGEYDLKRIYEPYFVALSKSETQQDNTLDPETCGVGLTIVKALVNAHDGRLWCESELGVGTRFFVALPKEKG